MGALRASRRSDRNVLRPAAEATVILEEPDALTESHDTWWTKLTETHERSLIGNLVRPEDLYLSPEQWKERIAQIAAIVAVEQLGIEDRGTPAST